MKTLTPSICDNSSVPKEVSNKKKKPGETLS